MTFYNIANSLFYFMNIRLNNLIDRHA